MLGFKSLASCRGEVCERRITMLEWGAGVGASCNWEQSFRSAMEGLLRQQPGAQIDGHELASQCQYRYVV
jgi:hypothetical protein